MVLLKERVTLTVDKELLSKVDARVDGVNIKNRSHAVELFLRRALRGQVPSTAIILAGGKGVKMLPLAEETLKPMLPIQGKPMLEHNLELLKRFGIRNVIISVGHLKEKIIDHFKDGNQYGISITYLEEDPEHPLGTAGPIRKAKHLLKDEPFLVLNADELKDINLEQFYHAHLQNNGLATIALTTVKDPSSFGVALLDGMRILCFVEKPEPGKAPSRLISAGIYIFEPSVTDLIPDGYAMLEVDLFPKLARESKLFGYPFAGAWYSPRTPEWLERIEKEWQGYKA